MLSFLQIATILLVAIAMALSLAHALEFPGKLRLSKENYLAVQPIYYPSPLPAWQNRSASSR